MQFWAEFTNWDGLKRAYESGGPDCLNELSEDEHDGIFENAVEPHIGDSNIATMDIYDLAAGMRKHLSPQDSDAIYGFLKFFCTYLEDEQHRPLYDRTREIPLSEDSGICAVYSPEHVRAGLEAFKRIPQASMLDAARKVWENDPAGSWDAWESPDEMVNYINAWGGVYQQAVESGRGLVFWNC